MSKLIIIIVLSLAILVLGSVLLVPMFFSKKAPQQPRPVVQASFSPAPFRPPLSPASTPVETKTLALTSISPTEDINQTFLPIKQVFFTFNEAMNPATFKAEASPSAEITISLDSNDPKTVIVSPKQKWQPGITAITIQQTTTSSNGNILDKPIVYKINTKFPDNPPPDIPGY